MSVCKISEVRQDSRSVTASFLIEGAAHFRGSPQLLPADPVSRQCPS